MTAKKSMEDLQQEVLELCRETVHPSVELDTDLIVEGLLDSFHTLKLVTELEDRYDLAIELSSLSENQVKSVRAISSFLFEQISR